MLLQFRRFHACEVRTQQQNSTTKSMCVICSMLSARFFRRTIICNNQYVRVFFVIEYFCLFSWDCIHFLNAKCSLMFNNQAIFFLGMYLQIHSFQSVSYYYYCYYYCYYYYYYYYYNYIIASTRLQQAHLLNFCTNVLVWKQNKHELRLHSSFKLIQNNFYLMLITY